MTLQCTAWKKRFFTTFGMTVRCLWNERFLTREKRVRNDRGWAGVWLKWEKEGRALRALPFPISVFIKPTNCHSERSEESPRANTIVIGNAVRNLPLHHWHQWQNHTHYHTNSLEWTIDGRGLARHLCGVKRKGNWGIEVIKWLSKSNTNNK